MTITTSDLPEALRRLVLEIQQTNTPLTITHEGQPISVIMPARSPKPRPAAGFMKGQGEILGNIVDQTAFSTNF